MNLKELGELRRRFRPDKSAIAHIYGCYVNSSREIIAHLDEPLGRMPQEKAEKYLGLLKKALSGSLGKNLIDIVFSTQQVMDSSEHRLLMALRQSGLKDAEARHSFYQKVIETLDMGDSNYLILLAHDAYDVPHHSKDGETQADAGDEVFSYVVCVICPVKDGKVELGFFSGDNEFHSSMAKQIVSAPELGFLFPAFDNRAANIYNALFYSRKPDELHQEFISAVFNAEEPPMSAAEQQEAFQSALSEALGESCSMDVVQAVHDQLREQIERHKESKDPEPLVVTAKDVGCILQNCGVPEERVTAFQEKCGELFGDGAALAPSNLIDSKRFEVTTSDITISADPARSHLIEAQIINGKKYILIPVDEDVQVNGLSIEIASNNKPI